MIWESQEFIKKMSWYKKKYKKKLTECEKLQAESSLFLVPQRRFIKNNF